MGNFIHTNLGVYIRRNRENKNLSLRELARRVGISASYLSDVERGLRNCKSWVLMNIARELGLETIHGLFIRAEIIPDRILEAYLLEPSKVYDYCVSVLKGKPQ